MHHKALKLASGGGIEISRSEVPEPSEGEILVKNVCVGLNPYDSSVVYTFRDDKHTGNILGCDYAGYVEKCGLGVERFKPGDRVAGTVFGGVLPNTGSFAEYSVADAGLAVHLPETTTFEEGATLGITGSTAGLVLWRYLGIPFPGSEAPRDEKWLLIVGGSTACGTIIAQIARFAGLRIVATASPQNFDFVKSYGAEAVFDRNDEETPRRIKEYTGGQLKLAVNCTSNKNSIKQVNGSMGDTGGKAVNLQFLDTSECRPDIKTTAFLNFESWPQSAWFAGFQWPPVPEGRATSLKHWPLLEKLLAEGKVKPHPVRMLPKGLEGIEEGLVQLRDMKVSGCKLVARIDDTPGLGTQ